MGDCTGMDEVQIGELRRDGRKSCAGDFAREFTYGRSMEQRTCIWSRSTYTWSVKSSGTMWVGVHGMNSICVVTRAGDLDVRRVRRFLKHNYVRTVLRALMKSVVSEIEDLADPSSRLRQSFGQIIEKPFAVVSVIPGPYEASVDEYEEDKLYKSYLEKYKIRRQSSKPYPGYDETKTVLYLQEKIKSDSSFIANETLQTSSVEYDEKKAIEFLKENMGWDATFTIKETIQTAISAFQLLFKKKFKADEIEVTVMDPNYFVSSVDNSFKDIYVKELEITDIEEHLAAINGLDSRE